MNIYQKFNSFINYFRMIILSQGNLYKMVKTSEKI